MAINKSFRISLSIPELLTMIFWWCHLSRLSILKFWCAPYHLYRIDWHRINGTVNNSFMTEVLSYKNQSIGLQSKAMDWFLYDRTLCHKGVESRAKMYLGLCQTSIMELFRETSYRLMTKKKLYHKYLTDTAQKIKFSINNFFSKCDQIRSFLQICSHFLKK